MNTPPRPHLDSEEGRGPALLTLRQTMAFLQVGERTVHELRRRDVIKAVKVGTGRTSPWRFSACSVRHVAKNPHLIWEVYHG